MSVEGSRYVPQHFDEPRVDVMHALMRARPLAALVTLRAGGLSADHIPLLVSASPPFGVLRGHVARADSKWRDFRPDVESLAVFQGPQASVSPSWYAAKQETGQAVPAWNCAVVRASGALRVAGVKCAA